jgi:hypothetical protein
LIVGERLLRDLGIIIAWDTDEIPRKDPVTLTCSNTIKHPMVNVALSLFQKEQALLGQPKGFDKNYLFPMGINVATDAF